MGLDPLEPGRGFVCVDACALDGARIVLAIRSASRVILELAAGLPTHADGLLGALCGLPWEDTLPMRTPWAVRAIGKSAELRHTGFAERLAKDGIRDRFRARGRECPPVDPAEPRVIVDLRIDKHGVAVGIDLGGGSLHERGTHRKVQAPIREHVAAGLAWLAGVRADQPLVDPFCGSGSLIAEAAAVALAIPAGRKAERTTLPRLALFRKLPLGELAADLQATKAGPHAPFLAFDSQESAVRSARMSLSRMGLASEIELRCQGIDRFRADGLDGPGLIISNPPWGIRLDESVAQEAWRTMGTVARTLGGWRLALLSGNPAVTQSLGLKASRRFPVLVGGIDARLLTYAIHERRRETPKS